MTVSPSIFPPAAIVKGLRRRPLLGLSLTFATGVALGLKLAPPALPTAVAAGALSLIGLSLSCRRPRLTSAKPDVLCVYLAAALAGAGAATLQVAPPSPRAAAVRNLDRELEIAFQIQVKGDPVRYTTSSGQTAWEVPAAISGYYDRHAKTWRRGSGALEARWRLADFAPHPRYGDRWVIRGGYYSGRPGKAASVSGHRFWAWRTELLSTDHGWPWIAQCYAWRRSAAARLSDGIANFPRHAAVIQALLLGLRQEIAPRLRDRFAATGTLHLVAISGLHVGVMTGVFIFGLQSLGVSRRAWFYFLLPLLTAYTLATGARPSAVRACIMALAYWSALPMRRRPDAPSALALAALIILGYNPAQLATPGFLFSFTVVAGLLVFFAPLHALLTKRLRERNAWRLPASTGWMGREIRALASAAAAMAAVSAIAWLMAAPLSARFFGRLSLIALPANLLLVPLAFLIVATGCLTLVCGPMVPAAGTILNHANLVWTEGLLRVLNVLGDLPAAEIKLSLPAWTLPAWYGLLGLCAWYLHCRQRPAG